MVQSVQARPSWMDPIVAFLRNGDLLEDKAEAVKT